MSKWTADGTSGNKPANKIINFGSWGEYLDYANQYPKAPYADCASRKTGGSYSKSWSGTDTFEEAVSMALEGFTLAEAKAKKLSAPIVEKVSHLIEQTELLWDTTGMGYDIGRVMSGEPEYMFSFDTQLTDGESNKIVRIAVNGFVSSGVSQEAIIARGAALAAVIELLEMAKFRVEVTYIMPFERYIEFRFPLKHASQPLDLGRLMFALAHPAMFRRISFSALEQNPKEWKETGCYGMPVEMTPEVHGADIYIGNAGYGDIQWTNETVAQQWVLDTLRQQGVKLDERAGS